MQLHLSLLRLIASVILAFLHLFLSVSANAQNYSNLKSLNGYSASIYYSDGAAAKSGIVAERFEKVFLFYDSLIAFRPKVTLLVLSPQDWPKYTDFPVYGMPHYTNDGVLVVASENNDFWKSFAPATEALTQEQAKQFMSAYTDANGNQSMEAFFDLLALHELGHAYSIQGGLNLQRKWMGELFSNIFLHTYIAENEPDLLPALTTLPQISVQSIDKKLLKFTTLEELENNYELIGKRYPANYAWYQFRWHRAADQIYHSIGMTAIPLLWANLKWQTKKLDDNEFLDFLRDSVHKTVADVAVNWNK